MQAIRSKNTKPELAVRRLVHTMGYRFRLHRSDLPGNPDLVFGPRKKAIFVHGCFWHCHTSLTCPLVHKPRSNTNYWLPKLQRNQTRDKAATTALKRLGWKTLTIWECQIQPGAENRLMRRIRTFLES